MFTVQSPDKDTNTPLMIASGSVYIAVYYRGTTVSDPPTGNVEPERIEAKPMGQYPLYS